jgi:hypothetical protein
VGVRVGVAPAAALVATGAVVAARRGVAVRVGVTGAAVAVGVDGVEFDRTAGVVGTASVWRGVAVPGVVLTVGFAAGVVRRAAVGAAWTVRATPGVGLLTLTAGGSGLDVSRLRGLSAVGVARAGAAGATGAGFAGTLRGTARCSLI